MAQILLLTGVPDSQRAIADLLIGDGHHLSWAGDLTTAWDLLSNSAIDLVIADLTPPELHGLALVRQLRSQGWRLPVIVITERGSEQLAAEALAAGASSYVSAPQLQADLRDAVEELAHYVVGESSYEQLMGCVRSARFEFELDNDPALIAPLTDLVQQMIAGICDLPRPQRLQLGVAFDQAVHNAMFRGNLEIPGPGTGHGDEEAPGAEVSSAEWERRVAERRSSPPYSSRRIYITAAIEPAEIRLRVRDDGPGFDAVRLLAEARHADQWVLASARVGRGLILMQLFTDELIHADRGNDVTLIKRSAAPTAGPAPAHVDSGENRPFRERRGAAPSRTLPQVLATIRSLETNETWNITSPHITIGRDGSCEVIVPHMDVSAHHCHLFIHEGWWFVADLRTKNGIRVNGMRVTRRRLGPQDVLSVARHKLLIDYDPGALGAVGPTPPPDPF